MNQGKLFVLEYFLPILLSKPVEVIVETLIHELAHAVIGPDKEDHGEEWELVLENIRCKYNELLELTAQKFGEGNSIGSDVLYLYFLH